MVEKLIEKIIHVSSLEGDIVLDPFCGSGTTLVGAKRLGRKYIGIDINEEYCEMAKKWLDETTPVPTPKFKVNTWFQGEIKNGQL